MRRGVGPGTPESHGFHRFLFASLLCVILPAASFSASRWDQRVNYQMDVYLRDATHSVNATASITYINNSPDTLEVIWFRLPPAALRDDAPLEQISYRGVRHRLRNVPEKEWGNLVVHSASSDNRPAEFVQDGSVGRLNVSPGILPGDSLRFKLDFTTKFPTGGAQSRIGYNEGQYKGAYWYPMVCPYTSQYGWTVNRYFGTAEAYGEFGDYDVRYHVPNRFIVASTGELVNQDEVLPSGRLAGLAFDNPNPAPVPTGEEGDRAVVWHYQAHSVTEVAFAMDPKFLIDRKDFGTFESWAFVRRGRQDKWSDAAAVMGWTIQQLEQIYGPYPWPRVMMTDSWSGMEYPMLTMMSSTSPRYHYFLMHEVIHNYTPMIIHSNTVDAQVFDEGFTTFVEHQLAEQYAGTPWDKITDVYRGPFMKEMKLRDDWERGLRPYFDAVLAGEDLPMVRGADVAEDYPLLRASTYYKTPVMLNALRYDVGEEKFWAGMREYYRRGAMHHIDETDVIDAFSDAAGEPLGWFFKPFLYSSGDIDYGVDRFRVVKAGSGWNVRFRVTRPCDIRLPLRMGVVLANGDTLRGEISFLPSDPPLPGYERWGSWDQPHEPDHSREFEVTVASVVKPIELVIDPDRLLADRDPRNNSTRIQAVSRFDLGLFPVAPDRMDKSTLRFSSVVGYAKGHGALAGVNVSYGWMKTLSRTQLQFLSESDLPGSFRTLRVGASNPLPTGFGPLTGVVYAGRMFQERWYEGGVDAKWRVWYPERGSFTAKLRVGHWEDRPFKSPLLSTSYLVVQLENSRPEGFGSSSTADITLATSLRTNGWFALDAAHQAIYDLAAWSNTPVIHWFRNFDFEVSERYVSQVGSIPNPFVAGPTFGMRYGVLGSPIAGSSWRSNGPYVDRPAILLNDRGMIFGNQMAALGFRLDWSPGSLFSPYTDTFFSRSVNFFHLGLWGSGNTILFRGQDTEAVFNLGVDVKFVHLYGVTVRVALPLMVHSTLENEPTYTELRQVDWDQDVRVMISLDPGLFVR